MSYPETQQSPSLSNAKMEAPKRSGMNKRRGSIRELATETKVSDQEAKTKARKKIGKAATGHKRIGKALRTETKKRSRGTEHRLQQGWLGFLRLYGMARFNHHTSGRTETSGKGGGGTRGDFIQINLIKKGGFIRRRIWGGQQRSPTRGASQGGTGASAAKMGSGAGTTGYLASEFSIPTEVGSREAASGLARAAKGLESMVEGLIPSMPGREEKLVIEGFGDGKDPVDGIRDAEVLLGLKGSFTPEPMTDFAGFQYQIKNSNIDEENSSNYHQQPKKKSIMARTARAIHSTSASPSTYQTADQGHQHIPIQAENQPQTIIGSATSKR
ncbi:hypothetical protein Nepgr_023949 [Nepenthes gracilis]|uniref:Uncharacterized protein n=1 Tax=Nepenthes gracilis TaxID=150966 RepID=A0AAD3T3S8_NEPGR|nr:hypothetical protein Nepgr_023949 [Nepenthes gracilis]